jgi:hypothetical protein
MLVETVAAEEAHEDAWSGRGVGFLAVHGIPDRLAGVLGRPHGGSTGGAELPTLDDATVEVERVLVPALGARLGHGLRDLSLALESDHFHDRLHGLVRSRIEHLVPRAQLRVLHELGLPGDDVCHHAHRVRVVADAQPIERPHVARASPAHARVLLRHHPGRRRPGAHRHHRQAPRDRVHRSSRRGDAPDGRRPGARVRRAARRRTHRGRAARSGPASLRPRRLPGSPSARRAPHAHDARAPPLRERPSLHPRVRGRDGS